MPAEKPANETGESSDARTRPTQPSGPPLRSTSVLERMYFANLMYWSGVAHARVGPDALVVRRMAESVAEERAIVLGRTTSGGSGQ